MDASNLETKLGELLDAGGGEPIPGTQEHFVPLVTLDSDARVGLDAAGAWVLVPGEGAANPAVVRFAPGRGHLFHEVLEWKRRRFDDTLEDAARALGLPAEETLFSFPSIPVIRAILERETPYLTRLALEWIAPTELRPLRPEILAASKSADMPVPVRELAQRLVVPL
jgi:hypothetical protein